MLAVIPVRDGVLPAGAAETTAECGGRALVVGSEARVAAAELAVLTAMCDLRWAELGGYRPGAWAVALAGILADEAVLLLPSSPDGRDLAPRLAAQLDRPLFAGAMRIDTQRDGHDDAHHAAHHVVCARGGGLSMQTIYVPSSFVATLQVGVRGVDGTHPTATVEPVEELVDAGAADTGAADTGPGETGPRDATTVELIGPDPATIDLAEAARIVGGGAGLAGQEHFDRLAAVGAAIGASVGATRVITDRGWVPHERQIGTTGVVVAPQLYLAFGVSGAVQHTSGLGHPDHIVSVNTDASCPMMQLADLAVVADANEVLARLEEVLGG